MAKRFRFPLETVRKLRRRERDRQQREVADAIRSVRRVQDRIALLTAQLHSTVDQSREGRRKGRLDMVSLRGHQFYSGYLQRSILDYTTELTAGQTRLEAERAKLGEASKRLKVIENLHQRQWNRHRAEVAREEQGTTDEVALQIHLRGGRHGSEERA